MGFLRGLLFGAIFVFVLMSAAGMYLAGLTGNKNSPLLFEWNSPATSSLPKKEGIKRPLQSDITFDFKQPLAQSKSAETISRNYSWQYQGKQYNWALELPVQLIDWDRKIGNLVDKFYGSDGLTQHAMLSTLPDGVKNLVLACSKENNSNVVPWVTEEANYKFASSLGTKLAEQAHADRYDSFQTAEFALSFVGGAIPYQTANMQLPVQTLADSGDCDCKAILLAAILKNMGYSVALLAYPHHMALGIAFNDNAIPRGRKMSYYNHNGTKYYFAETTSPGWLIGQVSDESAQKVAHIYPIN